MSSSNLYIWTFANHSAFGCKRDVDQCYINTICENIKVNIRTVICDRGTQGEEVPEGVSQIQPGPEIYFRVTVSAGKKTKQKKHYSKKSVSTL